jgi:hypothetical protein
MLSCDTPKNPVKNRFFTASMSLSHLKKIKWLETTSFLSLESIMEGTFLSSFFYKVISEVKTNKVNYVFTLQDHLPRKI